MQCKLKLIFQQSITKLKESQNKRKAHGVAKWPLVSCEQAPRYLWPLELAMLLNVGLAHGLAWPPSYKGFSTSASKTKLVFELSLSSLRWLTLLMCQGYSQSCYFNYSGQPQEVMRLPGSNNISSSTNPLSQLVVRNAVRSLAFSVKVL